MSEKRGQVRGKKGALVHMRKGVILSTRITQISEKNRSSEGRERWAYLTRKFYLVQLKKRTKTGNWVFDLHCN